MPTYTRALTHPGVFTRALILYTAVFLLTACSFGASATPTPTPVTLRYITFPGLAAAEDAVIGRYTAARPHITVAPEDYAAPPALYLAQPPVPDLMLITPGLFLDTAIATNGLTDLSNLWQESGAADALLPSLRSLSEREGKQFYLPLGYNWHGFYYDKAVFDQLGLQPPATWDQFVQLSETLWLSGIVPLSMSGDDPFLGSLWLDYFILRLYGPAVHRDLVAGDLPFTAPEIRRAVELWASLVESGYVHPAAATMGTQEALAAVVQTGDLLGPKPAMVLAGPLFLAELAPERRAGLGFFPFPALDSTVLPAEVVTAIGYMVPADAAGRDAALDFAAALASPAGREALTADIAAGGLYAPAFPVADPETLPAAVQEGIALVGAAQDVVPPLYMSVPPTLWPALGTLQQRLLAAPTAAQPLDLDALLTNLEAAR